MRVLVAPGPGTQPSSLLYLVPHGILQHPFGCWGLCVLGCVLQAKAELSSRKGLGGQELASPCGSISKGASPQPAPLSS